MVGRVVGVGAPAQQLVAVEGVDALVVRHHARAEVVDAQRKGRREQRKPADELEGSLAGADRGHRTARVEARSECR